MNLLLDVGNTALKWAATEGEEFIARGRIELTQLDDASAFEEPWQELSCPARVLVASVAPPSVMEQISAWCDGNWGLEAERVQASVAACGVTNAYREPARLGVDRWLTLVAARARTAGAACVVDCGTAVTVDVLDEHGMHLGGLIVPGLKMMARSLEECAQVRLDGEPDSEVPLLACDTVNAVRGGTLYAAVAFIDRVLEDVGDALAQPMQHLITGGDAHTMLPLLRQPFEHAPDLVLEGLAVLARERVCVS